MESKITGQLFPSGYDEDVFNSNPVTIPYFSTIKLKISFVEAKHESYLNKADKVLKQFLTFNEKRRLRDSKAVFKYYSKILKLGFCKDLNLSSVNEIWKHITPTDILINCDEKGKFYLCILCECSWEDEHGLQLVFKNGKRLIKVGAQDGHY